MLCVPCMSMPHLAKSVRGLNTNSKLSIYNSTLTLQRNDEKSETTSAPYEIRTTQATPHNRHCTM